MEEETNATYFQSLRVRATSIPLFDAMKDLTQGRKLLLREIGFGNFIDYPIAKLPGKLTYFVLENFKTSKMEIQLQSGSIKITPETVKKY